MKKDRNNENNEKVGGGSQAKWLARLNQKWIGIFLLKLDGK